MKRLSCRLNCKSKFTFDSKMEVLNPFMFLGLLRNTPCLLWEGVCRRGRRRLARKVPRLVKKTIPLDRNVSTRRKSNIQPWDWEALREVEESLRPWHWWKRQPKTKLAKRKDARGDSQRQKIA